MKLKFYRQIFEKYSNIKLHINQAEFFHADRLTEGLTDITKLIVAFRSFVKEPKNLNKLSGITAPPSQNSKEYSCSQEVKDNFATPVHLNGCLPYSFTQGKERVQSRQKLYIFLLNMQRWANFKG